MNPCFQIVQLIGGNFDKESEISKFLSTEQGIALFFSALHLYPSMYYVRHWCELARAARGKPVDCLIWYGEGEARKPIGGARMRWLEIGN